MQRALILLTLFVFSLKSNGQHTDLSARINYINIGRYNILDESAFFADRDFTSDNNYFYGGIVVESINAKNIVSRFRAGINREVRTGYREQLIASTGKNWTLSAEEKETEFKFAVGIGKYYDFDYKRISFKIGVELPVRISTRIHNNLVHENYYINGTYVDEVKIYFDEPRWHSIGINAFANLYVNFWKSFSIGAEIGNGFLYTKSKGKYDVTYEYYDANGKLTGTDIETDELNWGSFRSFFFNPYIGLSYRF